MGIEFAVSEASGVTLASATEVTTASTYRAAYSRGSISTVANTQSASAALVNAATEAWLHFVATSAWDNDDSDLVVVITGSAADNVFRLTTSAVATFQPQYWNGSVWTNSGSAIAGIPSVTASFVLHLVAGATGTWELFIDGVSVGSGSMGSATTDILTATLYCPDNNLPAYYSEIIFGDDENSLVGAALETEAPTADATDTDGTGTYADVDEIPFSDADGITFSSAAERHSFTSPARTGALGSILGVSVAARMKRDASGPQGARFYLKIGGTRYYSSSFSLGLGYEAYQYVWPTDPSTAAPWTEADAQSASLEWGIESVA